MFKKISSHFLKTLFALFERDFENLCIAVIIILVGLGAFGLGRLSVVQTSQEPFQIVGPAETYSEAAVSSVTRASAASGGEEVTASKNGTKYYYSWCSGASRIKEANKVTFASAKDAEDAGYGKSATCKELQ